VPLFERAHWRGCSSAGQSGHELENFPVRVEFGSSEIGQTPKIKMREAKQKQLTVCDPFGQARHETKTKRWCQSAKGFVEMLLVMAAATTHPVLRHDPVKV